MGRVLPFPVSARMNLHPSVPAKRAGEAVFSPDTIGSTAQWLWAWKATFHLAI